MVVWGQCHFKIVTYAINIRVYLDHSIYLISRGRYAFYDSSCNPEIRRSFCIALHRFV